MTTRIESTRNTGYRVDPVGQHEEHRIRLALGGTFMVARSEGRPLTVQVVGQDGTPVAVDVQPDEVDMIVRLLAGEAFGE